MEASRIIELLEVDILTRMDSIEGENRDLNPSYELIRIKNEEVLSELRHVLSYLNYLRKQ